MYAAGSAAAELPNVSVFRFRGARYVLATVGLVGLAIPYASGFAAFRQPAYSAPGATLPALGVPAVRFPELAVPKLHQPAALPPAARAANTKQQAKNGTPGASRRVPLVTDSYSLSTAAASASKTATDPFAKQPVVSDTVGAPPLQSAATQNTPAPATPPAAASDNSTPATPPKTPRGLAAVAQSSDTDISAEQPAAVGSDPAETQIESPPAPPATSGDQTVDVGTGIVQPPPIAAPASPGGDDASVTPVTSSDDGVTGAPDVTAPELATPVQPSAVPPDSTPTVTSNDGSQPIAGSSNGSGGASGAAQTSGGDTQGDGNSAADTPDGTTPNGTDNTPPDPAATPGSGPSPPGLVTPNSGGSAVAGDGSATVSFAPGLVSGSTVVSVVSADVAVPGLDVSSAVYDLKATDTASGATISHFAGSPVLTISYDPSKPTPTAIYYLDPVNGPVALPSTVDTVNHTITAALPHFSQYVAGAAVISLALSTPILVKASGAVTVTANVTQLSVGALGATVQFTLSGSAAFGGTSTCVTDASGNCTVTVSDSTTELVTITAVVNGSTPLAGATTTLPFVDFVKPLLNGTAHTVAVSVDGSNVLHIVDNTTSDTTLALSGLTTSVGIIGADSGDTYTLDGSLVAAGVTVYIAGGTGAESLVGPNVADMEWTISGVGQGSATSNGMNVVAFTKIDNVTGGNLADTFTFLPAGALVSVDGGGGGDTLVAPDRTATNVWNVTADDAGTLNGMPFTRFGGLSGGAGPDTFSIGSGVALSSGLAGGAGDATDTLDFPTGVPTEVDTTFLGPGTGSVVRDGKTVDYNGIELITDELTPANRVLAFSSGNDSVRLDQSASAGYFWVQPLTTAGAFATAKLSNPANGLTIQTLAGDDTIQLDSFAPTFAATVSIDAGAGNDSILVALPSSLATHVTVNGGDGIDLLQDLTLIPSANVSNVEILPTGIPNYTSQGPGPIQGTSAFPTHAGAVQQLAIDPFNDQIIYAGTVNGGIWLSEDGGATWTPKSDALPTLAIGSITIAPRDALGNLVGPGTARNQLVIYAGTGSFSSLSGQGGLSLGVLRSTDGGDTWDLLSSATLTGVKIGAIVALDNTAPATQADPTKQIVIVAGMGNGATGGIFVSTDSGVTFTRKVLSATAGTDATDLVADPGVSGRVYAAVVGVPDATTKLQTGGGVYRSDDWGATWNAVNTGLDALAAVTDNVDNNANGVLNDNGEKVDGAGRIVLAVQQTASSAVNSVYAALLSSSLSQPATGVLLMGIFVSTPTGSAGNPNGTWALVGGTEAPPRSATYTPAGGTIGFDGSTITRSAGDWRTDGFAVGQQITISKATDAANNGVFLVTAVSQLVLTVSGTFTTRAATTATIAGAALPDTTAVYVPNGGTLTFGALGSVTRSSGDWRAEGFAVGETLTIAGAVDAANNGSFTISAVSATILTITGTFTGHAATTATSIVAWPPTTETTYQPQVDKGGQGTNHFAMAVDGAGNVFIAGDVISDDLGWLGNIWEFTPKTSAGAASNAWTRIYPRAVPNRPYADQRDLQFDMAARPGSNGATVGSLYDATDGGVFKLTLSTGAWTNLNGAAGSALVNNEVVSAAYDPLNDVLFVGTQDAGVASQNTSASDGLDNNGDGLVDNAAEMLPWTFSVVGDGNTVLVQPVKDASGKITAYVHYLMGNNLSTLKAYTYDPNGNVISTRLPAFAGTSVTLTVTLGGDMKTFTSVGYGLQRNEGPFYITSTGTFPGGGTSDGFYYVSPIDANTFNLTDKTESVITFTSLGSGTLQLVKVGGLQVTLGGDGQTFTNPAGTVLPTNFGPFVMRSTGALPGDATPRRAVLHPADRDRRAVQARGRRRQRHHVHGPRGNADDHALQALQRAPRLRRGDLRRRLLGRDAVHGQHGRPEADGARALRRLHEHRRARHAQDADVPALGPGHGARRGRDDRDASRRRASSTPPAATRCS